MQATLRKFAWPLLALALLALAAVWWARQARFDVEVDGGALALDTINPALPPLAQAIRQHPAANCFRVRWTVLPDPARPHEVLHRWLVYDRRAGTLDIHRELPFYDAYVHVNDACLQRVAARRGGVRMLLRNGCTRSFPPEKS